MGNKFDEMRTAVKEAEVVLHAADKQVKAMACLLAGRLRRGTGNFLDRTCTEDRALVALKRELREFNSHTRKWKDEF